MHDLQQAGIDVLLDDRDERPGVMFADMELIGIPHRVVIGERGLKEGQFEYKGRRDAEATMIPQAEILATLREKLCGALIAILLLSGAVGSLRRSAEIRTAVSQRAGGVAQRDFRSRGRRPVPSALRSRRQTG